jgi:hypothetical protein
VAEREGVPGVEPAEIGGAAFLGESGREHDTLLTLD